MDTALKHAVTYREGNRDISIIQGGGLRMTALEVEEVFAD